MSDFMQKFVPWKNHFISIFIQLSCDCDSWKCMFSSSVTQIGHNPTQKSVRGLVCVWFLMKQINKQNQKISKTETIFRSVIQFWNPIMTKIKQQLSVRKYPTERLPQHLKNVKIILKKSNFFWQTESGLA